MHETKSQPIITEDEAALYDRQIRLWGLDAQRRLRGSRVLLIGVGGLGAEVAKNIILSGIKSITLLDHLEVTKEDFFNQFFVKREDLGKNRAKSSLNNAQALNPMVEVLADEANIDSKDAEFFKQFDVVCATCCSKSQLLRINEICHEHKINFYAGDVFGYFGYMFADLNEHEFAEEVSKTIPADGKGDQNEEPASKKTKVETETTTIKKALSFKPLKDALSVDWSQEQKKKLLKRMPHTYFIMQVLLEFQEKNARKPSRPTLSSDKSELLKLKKEVCLQNKVPETIIPDNFESFCCTELSPVSAIVGGVLGQEVIKAVSQKDAPHNNFFFYNGVDGSGMVDQISS